MIESREDLRAKFLRNEEVLRAIQMRAYEVWILRGRQFGRDREDWLLAENEVVNFLIEQELRNAPEPVIEATIAITPVEEVVEIVEVVATPLDITPELIPEADAVIAATAPVEDSETRKPRKRAATKTATTTRKPRVKKEGEAKQAVAKKTTTAKKTPTRKASSKKSVKAEQPVVE